MKRVLKYQSTKHWTQDASAWLQARLFFGFRNGTLAFSFFLASATNFILELCWSFHTAPSQAACINFAIATIGIGPVMHHRRDWAHFKTKSVSSCGNGTPFGSWNEERFEVGISVQSLGLDDCLLPPRTIVKWRCQTWTPWLGLQNQDYLNCLKLRSRWLSSNCTWLEH